MTIKACTAVLSKSATGDQGFVIATATTSSPKATKTSVAKILTGIHAAKSQETVP